MSEQLSLATPEQLQTKIEEFLELAKTQKLIPLIAVIGPTASGKTALGIALAQAYKGEIVSADSRQVYTEMNIATAKPTESEQQAIKHHLINLIKPNQAFTLSDYQKLAQTIIADIHSRGKVPFLVGGTGLYVNSITQNYALPASKPDLLLRQELEQLAAKKGKLAVHQILEKLDPTSAHLIHPNNLRYVIRAIEIVRQTTQPKSSQVVASPYLLFNLTIDWPRSELYEKINQRIDVQLKAGLIEETQQLLSKYPADLPALTSLGYQEISAYLEGGIPLDQALEEFKKNTRNYAKRQLTWFRKTKSLYSIPGTQLARHILSLQNRK